MNKIFIFDFDGTLVTEDILDVACDIVGKKQESQSINKKVMDGELSGLEPLCDRINFLKGVSYKQIKEKLSINNYLQSGALELFNILKEKGFITIISSGNIMPILKYYKDLLNVDYIFGTTPNMENDIILGIDLSNFKGKNFKYNSCLEVIGKLNIPKENIYCIGDSIVDKEMLSLAGHKFAINPKGGIENHVDIIIKKDLMEISKYL